MAFGTSSTRGDGASVADALVIRDLHVQFHTRRGVYKALNGVNLRLRRGEVLGIAGESGCGKTTMGLAVMALVPRNASFPQGQIIFDNKDLMNLPREYWERVGDRFNPKQNERILRRVSKAMGRIRGVRISMVFQEPMTSLNPVLSVGFQIAEAIYVHDPASLAHRVLARTRATASQMPELLAILGTARDDEAAVKEFAAKHDLLGIEDQVLSVWRRDDVHISRKEKAIRLLAGQQIRPVERNIVETVARAGSIPPRFSRVPVLSRVVRRVLLKDVYPRALGRDAAAGCHRDCVGEQSGSHNHGRAHERRRRDRPGADPRARQAHSDFRVGRLPGDFPRPRGTGRGV